MKSPDHLLAQHYITQYRFQTTRILSVLQIISVHLTQMVHAFDLDKAGFCRKLTDRTYVISEPIDHASLSCLNEAIHDSSSLISYSNYSSASLNAFRGRSRKNSTPSRLMEFEHIQRSFNDKIYSIAINCVKNIEDKQHNRTRPLRDQLLLDNLYNSAHVRIDYFSTVFNSIVSRLSIIQKRMDFFNSIVELMESFVLSPHDIGCDMVKKCYDLQCAYAFFPDFLAWTSCANSKFDCKVAVDVLVKLTVTARHLEQIVCVTKLEPFINIILTTITIFQTCATKYHEQIIGDNMYHCIKCGYDICTTCGYCVATSASLCQRCKKTNHQQYIHIYHDRLMDQIIRLKSSINHPPNSNNHYSIHDELYLLCQQIDAIWKEPF